MLIASTNASSLWLVSVPAPGREVVHVLPRARVADPLSDLAGPCVHEQCKPMGKEAVDVEGNGLQMDFFSEGGLGEGCL